MYMGRIKLVNQENNQHFIPFKKGIHQYG